jgi:hypothetical protein
MIGLPGVGQSGPVKATKGLSEIKLGGETAPVSQIADGPTPPAL